MTTGVENLQRVKFGNQTNNRDHPSHIIIEISQNIEKSHGDLRRQCHSDSRERLSANAAMKNLLEVK